MASTITIGGIDRSAYCRLETVRVRNTIVATNDTLDMVVSVYDGSWVPLEGQEVIWTVGANREFAGIIQDSVEDMVNPSHFRYDVAVKDYTWLLDRRMVVKAYTAIQAADVMVKDIMTNFTSGFTVANVQVAPNVNPQTFDYVYPSAALKTLADLIQWGWYVDYNKDLHFFALETNAAPVATIDFDNTSDATFSNLRLRGTIAQERNRVYLKGYFAKSTVQNTSTFTGNGASKFYALGYVPSALGDMTITRGGITQNLKVDQVDGAPGDGVGGANDVFVCFDNAGIRWNVAPSNGDAIVATYNYLFPGIQVVDNPEAQTLMKAREGTGDGIHEFAIVDPSLSDAVAVDRGNAYLTRYSMPRVLGEMDSYLQGWRAGQTFTGTSAKRRGGFTTRFYVQEVTKQIVNVIAGVAVLKYHIKFADNPLAL